MCPSRWMRLGALFTRSKLATSMATGSVEARAQVRHPARQRRGGDIRPENKSAIIAVTKNAAIPLENVKANLHEFVEDIILNWLDMMAAHYGERKVVRNIMGQQVLKNV